MDTKKPLNPQYMWGQLQQAIDHPGSPMRVFALGTVSVNHEPDQRSVVLREIDKDLWLVRIYTDMRSPKVLHLRNNPQVSLLFWDAHQKVQLRAKGLASIIEDPVILKTRWEFVNQGPTANDYKSKLAPGSVSDECLEYVDQHWFAVIEIKITSYDCLKLSRNGHQRWAVTPDRVTALVP